MAEMEEATAERIEGLNVLAVAAPLSAVAVAIRSDEAPAAEELNKVADNFIPMSNLCERLFAKYHLSSDVAKPCGGGDAIHVLHGIAPGLGAGVAIHVVGLSREVMSVISSIIIYFHSV
jgi:hypothetical protein